MKNKFIIITLFFFAIYACNSSNTYKKHSSGLEYRILKQSNTGIKIKEGDVIELKLKYFTNKDSLVLNSKEFTSSFKMKVKPSSHQGGSFEDAMKIMQVGDRYEFLIRADSFYLHTKQEKIPVGIQANSKLRFDAEVIKIVGDEELKREKALQNKQMLRKERVMLSQYISENKISQLASQSGLIYIEKLKGKGKTAVKGDKLTVHYIGKLINGQVFDSTYDRNEPFLFTLGDSSIIKGWNEGFALMRQGCEASLIIPSELAYGDKGFSTIIPPFSSLIFEVKLIKIN